MNKLVLSGWIEYKPLSFQSFETIMLRQNDGYLVDVSGRLNEAIMAFGNNVSCRYFVSDTECTLAEATERFIKSLYGVALVYHDKYEIHYSEWTSDVNYESILEIGGHNLIDELRRHTDKFLIIEFGFEDDFTED